MIIQHNEFVYVFFFAKKNENCKVRLVSKSKVHKRVKQQQELWCSARLKKNGKKFLRFLQQCRLFHNPKLYFAQWGLADLHESFSIHQKD